MASSSSHPAMEMKVLLRGDRGTGKSTLLELMKGTAPADLPPYKPTPSIQSANVLWESRDLQEMAKLVLWDVVDEGFTQSSIVTEGSAPTILCDARTVHVYRNTHAVIFLVDVTRPDTVLYVQHALESVPSNIHVLIVANFLGALQSGQKITLEDLSCLLATPQPEVDCPACVRSLGAKAQQREAFDVYCYLVQSQLPTEVRGLVASFLVWRPPIQIIGANLSDGHGLPLIHKWLCLPYCKMKAAWLEASLRKINDLYWLQERMLIEGSSSSFNYQKEP